MHSSSYSNQWQALLIYILVSYPAATPTRAGRSVWYFINPRRAFAAKITVVVLCVCLFVCLSTTILALQAMRRLMSKTNSFSAIYKGMKNNVRFY